jgi:pimeloyl-ACP methyl ester carboxylesterase
VDAVEKRVIELTSKDGTRIVCEKAGAGPAVVLVDGAFCFRRSGVTPRLVPLLSNNFTVYAYDRRGRGDSGNTLPYSVEREIEDLQAVMAAAGGSPFVVAFSSGAALAMRAVAAGLRPKKLVVFEPPYVGNGDVPAVPADAIEQLNARIASGRRSDAVTYFMTEIFGAPRLVVTLMKLFGRASWARNESVAHTLPYDIEVMGDFSVPVHLLRSVDVPTLVISGEKAPAKLRSAAARVTAGLPNAMRHVLPKQSHNVAMTVLAPVIIEWLK